jgi:peptidoglycan hydrolase CwlO-like protein
MAKISDIVDLLENRISKMLHKHEKLERSHSELEDELTRLKAQQLIHQQEMEALKQQCSSLKLANSMLGSDQYKKETKLKINALIREIDTCITQLSE